MSDNTSGAMSFVSTLDNTDFLRGIKQLENEIKQADREATAMGDSFGNLAGKAAEFAATVGGISFGFAGLKSLVTKIYDVRSYFQDINSQMEVFLGSQEKANKFTQDLKDYAYYNMFEFADLADASKQLIAYGNDVEQISGKGGILDKLSNIATATKQPLMDLVNAYNKAKNIGHVDAMGMQSWASKGLVLNDVLKDMGERVEGNTISFEQLDKALTHVTTGGRMFDGIMDKMMPNLSSSVGQLEDNLASMFNEIGESIQEPMTKAIDLAGNLVDNYKEVGKTIAELVTVYGAYRAIIATLHAYDNASRLLTETTETNNLSKAIATARNAKEGDAKATSDLVLSSNAHVMALQRELQAEIDLLKAQEAKQITAIETAEKAAQNAKDELDAAEELLKAAQENLVAEQLKGDATAIATAQKDVETATEIRNTAAQNVNSTATALNTATTQKNATTEAISTAQTSLNTAAKNANSRATNILTMAQQALGRVMKATGLSSLANPYVLATAAVVALGYAIYKLISYKSDEQKAIEKVNNIYAESQAKAAAETAELAELCAELENAKDDTEKYAEVKQSIIDKYADTHKGLEDEIDLLIEENRLYQELANNITNKYLAQAKSSAISGAMEAYSSAIEEQISAVYDIVEQAKNKALRNATDDQKVAIVAQYQRAQKELNAAIGKGELRQDADGNLSGVSSDVSDLFKERKIAIGDNATEYTTTALYDQVKKINDAIGARDAAIQRANEMYSGLEQTDDKEPDESKANKNATAEQAKDYEHLADLIHKITIAEREYAKAQQEARTVGGNIDDKNSNLEKTKKQLESLKKEFQSITNISFDARSGLAQSVENAMASQRELIRKQQEDLRKTREDEYLKTEQDEIDLMQNGLVKAIRQRELNQLKERQVIIENGRKRRKAVIAQAEADFDAEQKILEAEAKSRGDTKFRTQTFSREAFVAEQNNKADRGETNAFTDVDKQTNDEYARLLALQLKTRQEQDKSMLAERQKFYADYLRIETDYQARLKEIRELQDDGEITSEQATTLNNVALAQRNETMESNGYSPETMDVDFLGVQSIADSLVNDSLDQLLEALEIVEEELEAVQDESNNEERLAQLKAQVNALRQQVADKTKKNSKNEPDNKAIKQWQSYKKVVQQSITTLKGLGDVLGEDKAAIIDTAISLAQTTLQVVDTIVNVVNQSTQAMEGTSVAAAESIKTVEKASVILAIIEAALQVAMAIVNLFKSESAEDVIRANNAYLNDYLRLLDVIIDRNLKLAQSAKGDAEKSSFERSKEYYESAVETAKKQEEAIRATAKANLLASDRKHHSRGYKINRDMTSEEWKQGADALGMTVDELRNTVGGRFEHLFELPVETLATLQEKAPQFIMRLNSDEQEAIQKIVESGEKSADILAQQFEQTLGYSVEDLEASFSELFADLDSDAETFTEDFGERLKQNIVNSIISNEFSARLESIAKKQAKMIENDGKIDVDEYKKLMAEAQQIEEDRKKRMQELNDLYKFDDYADQQEATYGGYETMSEETGTELSGRFSAMYIVQSQHFDLAKQMAETIAANQNILANVGGQLNNLANLQGQTNMLVSDILSLQKSNYVAITDYLASINKTVKSLE